MRYNISFRVILTSLLAIPLSTPTEAQVTRSVSTLQLESQAVTINSAATDVVQFSTSIPKYIVRRVTLYEASTSLGASAATIGVFTGAGGTGTTVVTLATMLTLTTPAKKIDSTLALTTDYLTSSTLFVRCGTAHGSAATISVIIEIQPIP